MARSSATRRAACPLVLLVRVTVILLAVVVVIPGLVILCAVQWWRRVGGARLALVGCEHALEPAVRAAAARIEGLALAVGASVVAPGVLCFHRTYRDACMVARG